MLGVVLRARRRLELHNPFAFAHAHTDIALGTRLSSTVMPAELELQQRSC
jgi:hypothetical protein